MAFPGSPGVVQGTVRVLVSRRLNPYEVNPNLRSGLHRSRAQGFGRGSAPRARLSQYEVGCLVMAHLEPDLAQELSVAANRWAQRWLPAGLRGTCC